MRFHIFVVLFRHMQVRDLLNPAGNKKGGLKVRQHPSKGFYGIKKKPASLSNYNGLSNFN